MSIQERTATCQDCNAQNQLRITLSKRTELDKNTSKKARTAFRCNNCEAFNEIELSELGIDFEW